jgi:hypothetical protein
MVNTQGIEALLKRPLPPRRKARIDQYGIRCAFDVDSAAIKFEIVFEGWLLNCMKRMQMTMPESDLDERSLPDAPRRRRRHAP